MKLFFSCLISCATYFRQINVKMHNSLAVTGLPYCILQFWHTMLNIVDSFPDCISRASRIYLQIWHYKQGPSLHMMKLDSLRTQLKENPSYLCYNFKEYERELTFLYWLLNFRDDVFNAFLVIKNWSTNWSLSLNILNSFKFRLC